MPTTRPPKGYKRGFSDDVCHGMAARCMRSELGQQALREGWGRALYRFVMDWASTPSRPETIEKLKRHANEVRWILLELRDIKKPSALTLSHLRLLESADAVEADLKRRFLKDDVDDDRL